MKKLIVAAMVLSTAAVAQPDKDWWACQVVHSSGMKWENNRWVTTTFNESPPFVLMSDGNGLLTKESVAKAMNGEPSWYVCDTREYGDNPAAWCRDRAGHALYFDPETSKGGISRMTGTVTPGSNSRRDTVTVDAFECTKG